MKSFLRSLSLYLFLAVPLYADGPPEVTVSTDAYGAWTAEWEGEAGRTFFVQWSLDLQDWGYAPLIEHGSGPKSCGGSSPSEKFFVRLRYTDRPTSNAELDDFDGDGIPNIGEVKYLGSDPFAGDSDGDLIGDYDEDADEDGIPDGWEA